MKSKTQQQSGWTLLEILVVIAVVTLAALLLLPFLAGHEHPARRIQCTSNLKQVGLASLLWANDHEDQFPFASTNAESSLAWANSPQVFRHYQVLSNELVTPKVLVCTSDAQRTKTGDFTQFSNANLSYFVGLDAREDDPQQILSGDRNISGGTLSNGFLRTFRSAKEAGWTSDIHHNQGNVGLADGSVQQQDIGTLRKYLAAMTNAPSRLAIP